MRDYSKILLLRTGNVLWGPIERFVTIGGGLVGILVVFNRGLIDWLVGTYQSIPWWIGLLILGFLLLQAVFRAGYALWKEEGQARQEAERKRDELEVQNQKLKVRVAVLEKAATSTSKSSRRGVVLEGGSLRNIGGTFSDKLDTAIHGKNADIHTEGTTFGESSDRTPESEMRPDEENDVD